MQRLRMEISMSLDGFVAGPDPDADNPLGIGGEQLHEWVFKLASWREAHGREGGETSVDDEVMAESIENVGATIMGRNMFGPAPGPWPEDPPWRGWWGDEPPFHSDVFVLTHHPREPLEMEGGTTFHFVTDGPEAALERAREAAGEKDVAVGGGGETGRQYLAAGLLDQLQIHLVPVVLGGGAPLFDGLEPGAFGLVPDRAIGSAEVTHLRYRKPA